MKKHFLINFLFIVLASNINAQTIQFQKNYGGNIIEEGYCVQQTVDGGYIIGGNTNSYGAGSDDIYLIKTDVLGDIIWTKTYGGSQQEGCRFVHQTLDGGYVLTGYTNSFSSGNNNMYLIKTNVLGDTLWTNIIGGLYNSFGNYLYETIDSGYVITGAIGSSTITDFYLVKTTVNGDTVWTKKIQGTYSNSLCVGNTVQQTSDGGYIIAGKEVNNFIPASFGWLIKTDNNGDTIWTKRFTGLNYTSFNSLYKTSDGGYIITGITATNTLSDEELILIKTDNLGNILWTKIYGNMGSSFGTSVQPTFDGGFIISGFTDHLNTVPHELWLLKTNNLGDTLWTKSFYTNGLLSSSCVQQTLDSGYIITSSIRWSSLTNYDILLIKTDSLGNSPIFNLSVSEIGNHQNVLLFPNPFTSTAILQLKNIINADLDLIITNSLGQHIKTIKIKDNSTKIDRDDLVNGLYFYKIFDKHNIIATGKFIIQ